MGQIYGCQAAILESPITPELMAVFATGLFARPTAPRPPVVPGLNLLIFMTKNHMRGNFFMGGAPGQKKFLYDQEAHLIHLL
jgi:hypothetical protein